VVFLQTFFAGLRRLVLGQTTSGIDAKCGDHFLHADISGLIPEYATKLNRISAFPNVSPHRHSPRPAPV
jgi:hypothetical protein